MERACKKAHRVIRLELPDEFLELCKSVSEKPEIVLRGFIADLCGIMNWASDPRSDGYSSHGSDERAMARAYFERCGYRHRAQWRIREKEDVR